VAVAGGEPARALVVSLLEQLQAQADRHEREVARLEARIARLEEQSRSSSRNSSQPPSQDLPKTRKERRAQARAKAKAAIGASPALASQDPDFLRAVFGSGRRVPLNYSGYKSAKWKVEAKALSVHAGSRCLDLRPGEPLPASRPARPCFLEGLDARGTTTTAGRRSSAGPSRGLAPVCVQPGKRDRACVSRVSPPPEATPPRCRSRRLGRR